MQDNLAPQYRPVFYSEEPGKSEEKMPFLFEGEAIVEMGDDFDLGEYEVVRREFFSHLREPSLTFNGCKIYVNAASLARFPKTEYMQILINHNTGHICVSMYGISECTVNNTPQVIAKVDLEPSSRTENMSILSLVVENHKPDIFLVYSVEDFIEVVAELLAGDPFHCFDGFHAS